MSKHELVKCADCGSRMVPRTIYRRSVGFGGVVPGASFCPICQSTGWKGSAGFFSSLIDTFQLHPGLTLFAVIAFIPCGLALVFSAAMLLLSGAVIVLGLVSGESLGELLVAVDAGAYLFVFIGGVIFIVTSLAYIPLGAGTKKQ